MRTNSSSLHLLAVAGVLLASGVFAQELTTPAPVETPAPAATPAPTPAPAASSVATPSRGATMSDVRNKFGSPTQEVPAVGQPPITRWEYPGYVVFFENDRVLHTVIQKG